MGEIGFGQDFVTLLSFLHLWNIAAAGVLVTDKKVGSIGDYSSSSDLSGACSTDSDDVPRSRAENCLVLPPLLNPHSDDLQDLIIILSMSGNLFPALYGSR